MQGKAGKQPREENGLSLRTTSPTIRKVLRSCTSGRPLTDRGAFDEISGIHPHRSSDEKNEGREASIPGAWFAIQRYSDKNDHAGMARTYQLLADAQDPSTHGGAVNRAEYLSLAAHSMKRKIAEDKRNGASVMDCLEDEALSQELFIRAGQAYLQAASLTDSLENITEMYERASETSVHSSDYPAAYEAAANAAEYGSNPRVAEILSSVSDIAGNLPRGDRPALERIMITLAASADELSGRYEQHAEAAHIYAVLAQLEDESASKADLLKKAAISYTKAGDHEGAAEFYTKVANFVPGEEAQLYRDLIALSMRLSKKDP